MKVSKAITLAVALVLPLAGCEVGKEPIQPTPPSQTAELTHPPEPEMSKPPTVSVQKIFHCENVVALSYSAKTRGAVTENGKLLVWGNVDASHFPVYADTGVETVYDTELTGIVDAWLADSHILNDFALDINGQLWGFGTNARGLLLPEEIWPEDFVPIMDHVVSFTRGRGGNAWAAAVKEDGSVWLWGWPGGYDPETQTYPVIPPVQITDHASGVHYTTDNHLHMITEEGNLVDLGSGEEFLDGIVEKTLVRENTLWADGGYALGSDHALYRMDADRGWELVKENVRQVDCSQTTGFFLTENGQLYTWENQFLTRDTWNAAEDDVYTKVMDGVSLAAPLWSGVTVYLDDGSVAETHSIE